MFNLFAIEIVYTLQLIFIFPSFLGMVMYANEFRKIKIN